MATDPLHKAAELIKEANYVLIGVGAGLSAEAGNDYTGTSFGAKQNY